MQELTVQISGLTPLMIHNPRLSNPLDPYKKALGEVTSKKKKTDDDHAEISWREWLGGLYLTSKGEPCVPAEMVMAVWRAGARKFKLGKDLSGGLMCNSSEFVIDGVTPPRWDSEELLRQAYNNGYADIRSVGNQRNRVMRTRPIFRNWGLMIVTSIDEELLNSDDAVKSLRAAGRYVGMGDFRPECGGIYGRFDVDV